MDMMTVAEWKDGRYRHTLSAENGNISHIIEDDENGGCCDTIPIPNAEARDRLIEALKGMVF